VIKIFKEESIDEVIFWNSDISNYDGMFTYTDIIKVVLRFYKNAVNNVTPGTIFKKTNEFLAYF
jgi:5'-AMP-activated protein kinase regulatory gamma subunit